MSPKLWPTRLQWSLHGDSACFRPASLHKAPAVSLTGLRKTLPWSSRQPRLWYNTLRGILVPSHNRCNNQEAAKASVKHEKWTGTRLTNYRSRVSFTAVGVGFNTPLETKKADLRSVAREPLQTTGNGVTNIFFYAFGPVLSAATCRAEKVHKPGHHIIKFLFCLISRKHWTSLDRRFLHLFLHIQ